MNIKSLLLGSAAALVAVSGARAADAIDVVAEPEPAEYVRVCDTYGTGYFYIPGTETCLRIGGYVRFDVAAGDGPYGADREYDHQDGTINDTYHANTRFTLRTWTGSETELGTLSTFTETRMNYADGAGSSLSLNFAWIQLGGLRLGKGESAYTTFSGYAGGVIADDMIGFGPFDTNLISYTFDAGNGFSAIVSLEQGASGEGKDHRDVRLNGSTAAATSGHDYTIDSYVPHIVGGVKYAGGWGSATLVGGYDSIHENYAVKARVDVNVNEQFSLFVMGGYGTDDVNSELNGIAANGDRYGYNYYKPWGGNWAVWGGGSYKVNDKATVNVQASYAEGYSADGDVAVAANLDYELVKGFHVIPEVTYSDYGSKPTSAPGTEGFGGMIRFQRNF